MKYTILSFCWLACVDCVQVFVTQNGDYKITEPELNVTIDWTYAFNSVIAITCGKQ